jgi:hypothetical protein
VSESVSQGWGCRGEVAPKTSAADVLRERLKAAGFSEKEVDDYLSQHPEIEK